MSVINHTEPVWGELSQSIAYGDKNAILKIVNQVGINRMFSGTSGPQTILSKVIENGSLFGISNTSRKEYVDFIRVLLTLGACPHLSGDVLHNPQIPVHMRDPHRQIFSALYWAVYKKYYDILKLFIEFKVDFRKNDSILQYLILYPTELDYEIFKLLALNGANINCKVYMGKIYPSLLDFYNSFYVTGNCNENDVAKKIKKILEYGIQHVIELEIKKQKEAEIELQKQKELELKRREEVELQNKKINYEYFLTSRLQNICDNIKTFEINYFDFDNQIQTLISKNESVSSRVVDLSKYISQVSDLLEQFHIHKSKTECIQNANKDEIEIKSNEVEKMTFEQKKLYFDELETKINVNKQKMIEQKLWISNVLTDINTNMNIKFEQNFNDFYNIIESNKSYQMKSHEINKSDKFVKLMTEHSSINNLISTLSVDSDSYIVPDIIKQNVRSTNCTINQYYSTVDKFKNDVCSNTFINTVQDRVSALKQIEDINDDKYHNLLKQKNEFIAKSSSILPHFEETLKKIDVTIQHFDTELEKIKKSRLYNKTEAGTYIKLALDQIQSISMYGDAIPPELKEFYGKNIAHLLIQAKLKMPHDILKELIPKLPQSFHPYLTTNETKFDDIVPPWKK